MPEPSRSMNGIIHAAVRRDLARLSAALDSAADGDRARAADLHRAWSHLRDQLHHHHDQEESLLFPAFAKAGVGAELIATMESEHEAMMDALGALDATMTTYAASASAEDAGAARGAADTAAVVIGRHLDHEETELEPLVRTRMDDPHVAGAFKQLRKAPPTAAGQLFAWVRDGAAPDVLADLDATVPKPVQKVLVTVFGRRYTREIAPVWR